MSLTIDDITYTVELVRFKVYRIRILELIKPDLSPSVRLYEINFTIVYKDLTSFSRKKEYLVQMISQ